MAGLNKDNILHDDRITPLEIAQPLVSIIVTNYNYESYIIDCLHSIAQQDYLRFHCVIVDDCSTDNSIEKIESFVNLPEHKDRFSLIKHKKNKGQMGAFITGLAQAKGVFVCFIDADDLLLADFLGIHVQNHLNHDPVAFTSSDQYQINENNELIGGHHTDLQTRRSLRHIGPRYLHNPFWVWATASSMMFRKATLDLILPNTDDDFRICADNFICHFANLIGGSLLIPDVVGCYRRHGQNNFSSNTLVGGCHPTGDMSKHPRHEAVRLGILKILVNRYKYFNMVLPPDRYIMTFARIANGSEVRQAAKSLPDFRINHGNRFFLKISMLYLLIKIYNKFKIIGKIWRSICPSPKQHKSNHERNL